MRKVSRGWFYVVTIVIVSVVISGIIYFAIPVAPKEDVKAARKALHAAEIAQSKQYASVKFNQAKKLYDSAIIEWKRQNQEFIFTRDYSKVSIFSVESEKASIEAKSLAKANSKELKIYFNSKLDTLRKFVSRYDSLFRSLPLSNQVRSNYQSAKIALSEGSQAYKKNSLTMAVKKITHAEDLITKVRDSVFSLLNEYGLNYSTWARLADNTIKHSRHQKTNVLLIDKFAKKCYVYQKGQLRYTFNIELGKNWIGNKKCKNDKATPEGLYKIEKKISAGRSKYYKALLINYPNDNDRNSFNAAKKKGIIPADAEIGGLIEIHGEGGKGANWTSGCVALTNQEMDIIYDLVNVGTPVAIVGSLSKMSDIIDSK